MMANATAPPVLVEESVVGRPAAPLRPFIAGYGGFRREGFAPGSHLGLPSRHVTVIISLGRPIDIAAMPDPRQQAGAFMAFVGGLHATAVTVRHDGNQYGLHLYATPLGVRTLFGLPAAALASSVVALRDVMGPRADELTERLRAAPSWEQRFGIVDDVFTPNVAAAASPAGDLAWAWRRLVASNGNVPVSQLADEAGSSRRHFGERFRAELGLTPKTAARVLRFERACTLLHHSERPSVAQVAAACGYYDQAHLAREWNAMAGCAPGAWIREELPFVQDHQLPDAIASPEYSALGSSEREVLAR